MLLNDLVISNSQAAFPPFQQTLPGALAGKFARPNTAPSSDKHKKPGHINVRTVKHVD